MGISDLHDGIKIYLIALLIIGPCGLRLQASQFQKREVKKAQSVIVSSQTRVPNHIEVFANSDGLSKSVTFRTRAESARYESNSFGRAITYETYADGIKTALHYVQISEDKYILDRISNARIRPLFLDANTFSSAETSVPSDDAPTKQDKERSSRCGAPLHLDSLSVVKQSSDAASKSNLSASFTGDCLGRKDSLAAAMTLLHEPSAILRCQNKFNSFRESANRISNLVSAGSILNIRCSNDPHSNFFEPSTVTIGADVLESTDEPTAALYHELLHSTGISSEHLDQSIVNCCVKKDSKSSCELADAFSKQNPYFEKFSDLKFQISKYADKSKDDSSLIGLLKRLPTPSQKDLSAKSTRTAYAEHVARVLQHYCETRGSAGSCEVTANGVRESIINDSAYGTTSLIEKEWSRGAMGSSAAQDGNLIVADMAANENSSAGNSIATKTNVASSMGAMAAQAGAFSEDAASSAQPAALVAESTEVNVGGTKVQTSSNSARAMAANLGTTSASGESGSDDAKAPTRILAEEPRYTPGGASAADMRRDAQRYSAPMAKIAEQAQSYERTIAANIGWGVANAASIKLPVSNSDGSSSTSLKSFNPTTGETTLNALDAKGHEITITSAPVSFDGAQPSFEIRNAAGGVVAQTGSYKSGAAQGRQVPKLSDAVTSETGTTRPGRIVPGLAKSETAAAQASSGASGGGFSQTSAGSLSLASTGSSGARTQPSANANRLDQPLNVKQLVMRAPYTDHQRMRSLYEKVKEADFKKYDRPEENPSVTFRYCGVNYPAKFLGKNFVNLDVPNANKAQVCRGQGRLDE